MNHSLYYLDQWRGQDKHFQWQNLALFLAALGGVCIQEDQEDLNNLTSVIPAQYLPDEMRVLQNPVVLMQHFVTDLTNFVVAEDRQVREIARDALGAELSPGIYSPLIKHWDE
jgi:neurofibromin 1